MSDDSGPGGIGVLFFVVAIVIGGILMLGLTEAPRYPYSYYYSGSGR